jgi:hypothetical protein
MGVGNNLTILMNNEARAYPLLNLFRRRRGHVIAKELPEQGIVENTGNLRRYCARGINSHNGWADLLDNLSNEIAIRDRGSLRASCRD